MAAIDGEGARLLSVGTDDFKLRLWGLTKQSPEPRDVAKAKEELMWAALRPDGRQLRGDRGVGVGIGWGSIDACT